MTSALQVRCSLKRTGFYLPLKPHVELHSGWARGRDISSCKPLSAREKNLFLFFFFFSQREKFPSFSKTFIEDLLYFVRGGPENTGKDMVCVITDL